MSHRTNRRRPIGVILSVGCYLLSAMSAASASDIHSKHAGTSRPIIVFQSGLGDGLSVWNRLTRSLSAKFTTFSYDRPGYGKSEATSDRRDPCTVARELHDLLAARKLTPPYILVGHSLGGLYQYVYARLYPNEVAGLVLIEPTHPQHWETMQRDAPASAKMLNVAQLAFSAIMKREFADQAVCTDELSTEPLSLPVRLLVRTQRPPLEKGTFEAMEHRLQGSWQQLTGGQGIEKVPNAGHYIQRDQPERVLAVIAELAGAGSPSPPSD